MKKLFPRPVLSVLLLIVWALVQMSVSPGTLVMGGILAIILPLLTQRFWPNAPRIKDFWLLTKYVFVFLWDVVVANIQVAVWIAGPQSKLRPRFVYIPLEIEHPFTITVLASTISLTPGTVSAHLSGDRKMLIVHALNSKDDQETVETIKERYEKPLKEIFE
jgi:multicomponent K+:H+ antiporter subunit E